MRCAGLIVDFFGVLTDGVDASPEPPMFAVLRRAREGGVRTGLLSNSAGPPADAEWLGLFDALVFSGVVGLAKPQVEIYALAAKDLGLRPAECVFVDDAVRNVHGAVAAGMIGVRHTDIESTVAELEILFGFPFPARRNGPAG